MSLETGPGRNFVSPVARSRRWGEEQDRRFREENSNVEVVRYEESLAYRELALASGAMFNERSALFLGSLATAGRKGTAEIRGHLSSLGISLYKGQFSYDDVFRDTERLQKTGFLKEENGKYSLTKLGLGLGVAYAGQMLDFSAQNDLKLKDLWGKPSTIGSESRVLDLVEGEVAYKKNSTETKLVIIEQLVKKSVKNRLPISVADFSSELQELEPGITETNLYRLIEAYAQNGVVSHSSVANASEYNLSETRSDDPPPALRGSMPLTEQVYKYILMHPDSKLTAKSGLEYIVDRYPERHFNSQEKLLAEVRGVLKELSELGYIDRDLFGISLSRPQERQLRDLVVRLRRVQKRDPEGAKLLVKIFEDRDKLQFLVDKAKSS